MDSIKIGKFDLKYLTIALVIVVVVGAIIINVTGDDTNTAQNGDGANQTSQPQPNIPSQDQALAELMAVGDYSGSGTATRWIENGVFHHEVVATLDDPAEGKFYEGWLVGPSVVSTGQLGSEGDGQWSLIFSSEENLDDHNQIVITEETLANGLDGVPEAHVLEGSF